MLASIWRIVAMVCAVLAVAAVVATFYFRASAARADLRADAEHERANVLAQQVLRADQIIREERESAARMAGIAEQYERDKADAQDRSDRRAADLVRGNVQLRREVAAYATAQLSRDAAASRELDATAQRGAELVAAAVAVGARCDATQRGLIRAYEVNREPVTP